MTRRGRQEPTFEVVGTWARTDGPECCEVFESYGFGFDDAQRHQMDLYLARDAAGRFAATSIGLSVPRQNGKSYAARWYAVWCAAVCGMKVVYSAHNGDTVSEFFEMLTQIFEDEEAYPDFADMLDGNPYRQPGKERITFKSGGRIRFMTRTNNKSRGGTCSVLVVDEAQELTDPQLNAMLPTVSASATRDMQTIYIGTPPDPTCAGTVFRRMRDKAHSADPGRDWWMEWAAERMPPEGTPEAELLELAYETNQALGVRITEDAVVNEMSKMTADGFARERLGWWSESGARSLISKAEWDACRTKKPPGDGLMCVGVKFSPDGDRVALAVCLRPEEGAPHVEVAKAASATHGTTWVAEWLLERRDKVASAAVDGKAGAATVQRLRDGRFPEKAVRVPGPSDMAKADSMLVDAVRGRALTHFGQPDLDAAATRCGRRKIGADGYGFEDTDEGDSTLIEACALAYREAMTTKRRPGRKMRVG